MKLQRLFATTLVLMIALSSPASETPPSGCQNPSTIAQVLVKLKEYDWQSVSSEKVQSIWPRSLTEVSCESKQGCRFLVSQDRIIGGHCECCETFVFEFKENDEGSRTERLDNIIVHYSARSRKKVAEAAKELVRAAGLAEVKVATVGSDSIQRYEWQAGVAKQARQSYILELRFTRAERNWELYLSLGADAIEREPARP
jgi:hypothetical protein